MVHCVFSGFTVIGTGTLAWFQYHFKSPMFCHGWRSFDWYLTRLDAAVFNPGIELIAKGYVNLFRSIPLLLVLMWFYFAVPFIYTGVTGNYLTMDTALVSSIVAFMLFEAAYFSEIVRAGIQSIPKGQTDAASALGMNYSQSMRLIVLPQAFRKMTPLLLQQTIILFQDSTMVYAIGLLDFFRTNYVRGDLMSLLTQYILFAGLVYFTVSMIATYIVKKLQQRLTV